MSDHEGYHWVKATIIDCKYLLHGVKTGINRSLWFFSVPKRQFLLLLSLLTIQQWILNLKTFRFQEIKPWLSNQYA